MVKQLQIQLVGIGSDNAELLKDKLGSHVKATGGDIEFKMVKYRGLESAVIVALIGATGAILVALIRGLLEIRKQLAIRKISIQGPDFHIVVPADIDSEELNRLVDKIRSQEEERIKIFLGQ